jgi:formylmethanofuran dehydrogenase subunit C
MALATTALPYGARDLKIYTLTGETPAGTGIDLPNIQTLSWSEAEDFDELRGDDGVVAVHGKGASCDWSLNAGGLNFEAMAAMYGGTITSAGSTPNVIKTWAKKGTDIRPYFQIKGQAISDSGGDVVVTMFKARCTGEYSGEMGDGAFWISGASGRAIPLDSTDDLWKFEHRETSAALT